MFIDNLDGNQWPKAILQYPAGLWVTVKYISLPNFIIFTFEMWSANSIWLHKSKQLIFLQKVNNNDLNVETT